MFKKPLSTVELVDLSRKAGGTAELFSWKSPTARSMGLKPGTLSDSRMIELMAENPQLIRRPVILKDGMLQLGFGKEGLKV